MRAARGVGLALVVVAVASFTGFRGILHQPHHPNERGWIHQGSKLWPLFRDGEWDRPEWSHFDSSWGYMNPPVAKYILGASLSAHGVDWRRTDGVDPPEEVFAAARFPSVILGSIGCLGVFWIGGAAGSPGAGFIAALALALSPVWIVSSRLAMTDVYGATFAILAVGAFVQASTEWARKRRGSRLFLWVGASGLLCGTAMGCKLNAAPTPIALGAILIGLLVREAVRPSGSRRRNLALVLGLGVFFAAAAAVVFVGSNPYLHTEPLARFMDILDRWQTMYVQTEQLAESRGQGPAYGRLDPGIRVFVAKLAVPWKPIGALLAIPFLAAFAWRRVRRPARGAPEVRAVGWLSLIPALAAASASKNQILQCGPVWIGFLGGVTALALSRAESFRPRVDPTAAFVVLVWGCVSAFLVWFSIYIPHARYFAPLLPFLCLLAGFGIASLREDLRGAGSWAVSTLDAAVAVGMLSSLAAFPDYFTATIQEFGLDPASPWTAPKVLYWVSIAGWAAASSFLIPIVRRAPRSCDA